MPLPKLPIKAYNKHELRVLLYNPSINLRDERAVAEAHRYPYRQWIKLLKTLRGRLPEEEWLRAKVLSEEAVRLLLKNG